MREQILEKTWESKYSDIVSRYSSRVQEETRDLRMRSMTETNARLIGGRYYSNIIILDVDREVIVTYSSPGYSWKYSTRIQSAMLCVPRRSLRCLQRRRSRPSNT